MSMRASLGVAAFHLAALAAFVGPAAVSAAAEAEAAALAGQCGARSAAPADDAIWDDDLPALLGVEFFQVRVAVPQVDVDNHSALALEGPREEGGARATSSDGMNRTEPALEKPTAKLVAAAISSDGVAVMNRTELALEKKPAKLGAVAISKNRTGPALEKPTKLVATTISSEGMVVIVNTTAIAKKGQFVDRVRRRVEGCPYNGKRNLTAALARQRDIPFVSDILGGVADSISGSVYNQTFITIASAINSTLLTLEDEAVDLLTTCLSFRNSLLQSVSRTSDLAWDVLDVAVVGFLDTFMKYWVPTLDTLQLVVPVVTELLAELGYESVAEPFNETMTSVLQKADEITGDLANTTYVLEEVANLRNASDELVDGLLAQLENITDQALAKVTEFGDDLEDGLMDLVIDLANIITGLNISQDQVSNAPPGTVEGTIGDLAKEVDNITDTLINALDAVFSGISDAARLAAEQSGSAALQPTYLLPLLCGLAILLPLFLA